MEKATVQFKYQLEYNIVVPQIATDEDDEEDRPPTGSINSVRLT